MQASGRSVRLKWRRCDLETISTKRVRVAKLVYPLLTMPPKPSASRHHPSRQPSTLPTRALRPSSLAASICCRGEEGRGRGELRVKTVSASLPESSLLCFQGCWPLLRFPHSSSKPATNQISASPAAPRRHHAGPRRSCSTADMLDGSAWCGCVQMYTTAK